MTEKKLIIFDCDGVLVDSEFVSSKVFSKMLSTYGYSISVEDCIKRFTGMNEDLCREEIMNESGLDIPKDYWKQQFPILQQAFETELKPLLQPVLEMLESLNIKRCVASNSSKDHISHCLEFTNQIKFFKDSSLFSSTLVPRAKPAPDLFLFAADQMGVKPENCIVIEDSAVGAKAAIAAGMQVRMFLGGTHAKNDWYKEKLTPFNIPMHSCPHDLASALKDCLA